MKDTSRNQSAELKHAGLKATGPRMKILEIFQEASLQGKRHMSADDVYKALQTWMSALQLFTAC